MQTPQSVPGKCSADRLGNVRHRPGNDTPGADPAGNRCIGRCNAPGTKPSPHPQAGRVSVAGAPQCARPATPAAPSTPGCGDGANPGNPGGWHRHRHALAAPHSECGDPEPGSLTTGFCACGPQHLTSNTLAEPLRPGLGATLGPCNRDADRIRHPGCAIPPRSETYSGPDSIISSSWDSASGSSAPDIIWTTSSRVMSVLPKQPSERPRLRIVNRSPTAQA